MSFQSMPLSLTETRQRNRLLYAGLVVLVIGLGLASRKFAPHLPKLLQKNAGDILWATMAFLLWGLLLPRLSTLRIAACSALFSLTIEVLKLCHAPFLETMRNTTLGRLVFGFVFQWKNLLCYGIGIGLGVAGELWRSAATKRLERSGEFRDNAK
jgi:hypothetical protein